MAELRGMAPVIFKRRRPFFATLRLSWFVSLVVTAVALLLIHGDPAACLVLAVVLPMVLLLSPTTGAVAALTSAAGVSAVGFMVAGQPEFTADLRADALTIMILAPMLGLAAAAPAMLRELGRAAIEIEAVDQSSTSCMSDSTSRATLGKLTPETNRSKAA